jgi:hypothetical protein
MSSTGQVGHFGAVPVQTCLPNGTLAHETHIDPDLARLIAAWPTLHATAKRMILAAVEASGGVIPPR